MATIEIEGDPAQRLIFEGQTGCPLSGERIKSVLCHFRVQCELLTIHVRAEDERSAREFTEYAAYEGQIPKCLNGRPFLTRMVGETLQLQLTGFFD